MGRIHPQQPSSSQSRRQLSVIYFVDSAKTRSLSIPLVQVNLLLGLLLFMIVWSVVSAVLVVRLGLAQNELTDRLRESLATIFEYQSRHDHVYEVAYPSPTKPLGTGEADQPTPVTASAQPLAAAAPRLARVPVGEVAAEAKAGEGASSEAPSSVVADQTAVRGQPAASAPPAAGGAPSSSEGAPAPAGRLEVRIERSRLELGGDASLVLKFDLVNKSPTHRAEGYIWAVAKFVTDQGEPLFVAAPSEVGVQGDGEPTQPRRSVIFAIKRFTNKTFTFAAPSGQKGRFAGVRIGVMDRTGGAKINHDIPAPPGLGSGG